MSGSNFFVYRFLPYNIMHVLHDDVTGLFFGMLEQAERHGKPANSPWPIDVSSNRYQPCGRLIDASLDCAQRAKKI